MSLLGLFAAGGTPAPPLRFRFVPPQPGALTVSLPARSGRLRVPMRLRIILDMILLNSNYWFELPRVGLEPTRCRHHQILSLARIPIPPPRLNYLLFQIKICLAPLQHSKILFSLSWVWR